MKKSTIGQLFSIIVVILILNSCKENKSEDKKVAKIEKINYQSFGEKIDDVEFLSIQEIEKKYGNLKKGDTVAVKFKGEVAAVCPKKGCWMKFGLSDGEQLMVKFKDYGFFMPKDIAKREVIVNGLAFVKEVSVDEQRHYAEDAGKTKEEIEKIVAVKRTFSFEADGVLLKE